MYTFLTILIIIAALLLILVVLVQKPKGGGLASQFSSSNLAFGVKRTTDFIEKSTWGLAIAIIVLALASNFFAGTTEEGAKKAINADQLENTQGATPTTPPQPAQPTQQAQPTDSNQ
ncbi:MAG: preprotein translocase subunit SecG [Bacteroidota bacterium]